MRLEPAAWLSKTDAINRLRLVPGVWLILDYLGSSMRVVLFFQTEPMLKRKIELIRVLADCKEGLSREIVFPHCAMTPAEVDWEIVRSLETDPTKSYDSISAEISASNRTVRRRLERMVDSKALFMVPRWDPSMLEGGILGDLTVFFESPRAKAALVDKVSHYLDEDSISAQLGDSDYISFKLLMSGLSRASEVSAWVNQQRGVANATMDLIERRIENFEEIRRRIDSKIAPTQLVPA